MGEFFQWLVGFLDREKAVTRQAWKPLVVLTLLFGGAVWYFTSMYYAASYEGTIRENDAALKAVEKQRDFAQDQVRGLQSQLDKSTQEIATLQSQLSKDTQKSRPYTISKEDEVEFIQTLSSAGRYEVTIQHLNGNEASLALARRMRAILEECWHVRSFDTNLIGGDPPTGVIITASKEDGTPLGASLLRALLTKHHIETRIEGFSPGEGEPRLLKIYVGPDPRKYSNE